MKFFVTGVNGQLGHDVMNELHKRGHEGVGSDLAGTYAGITDASTVATMPYVSLDITEKEAVRKVIAEVKPDAVIHCAAWTAVDMAEDDDKVEKVRAVNAGGTQNIADVCRQDDITKAMVVRETANYEVKHENKKRKGGLGELVEERFFHYQTNNDARPDFDKAGVELKVTPYKQIRMEHWWLRKD